MNTDATTLSQIQSMLSGNSSGGTPSLINTDAIIKAMLPITIILTVISVLITVLYVISIVQRMRVNHAILESRDLLREMNERDKARTTAPAEASRAVEPAATPPTQQ
jgi:hypothetical protein